ncbi:pentapeptide repeat-containing protein [Thalassospira sp.]|uniref:pentapeptide repeat-containing protein n=1 Tax=Thalassospira sp. TaxID=1912094 RepID=UPI003AA92F4D
MHEPNQQEQRKTLKGSDALKLWRQGRDAWNCWIDTNPTHDISFSGVDFSNEWTPTNTISFELFRFGDGKVDFSGTKFGDRPVTFSNSEFGKGDVSFTHARFGNGLTDFSMAIFSECNVSFLNSDFGRGNTHFVKTNFKSADFAGAYFRDGDVNFSQARIESIDLSGITCLAGDLLFRETSFFGEGEINLNESKIDRLLFQPETVGSTKIVGYGLTTEHRAVFEFPSSAGELKSLILMGASINGPLILSGNFNIVPDLLASRLSHQAELSSLKINLRRKWEKPGRSGHSLNPHQAGYIARLIRKIGRSRNIKFTILRSIFSIWTKFFWPIKLSPVAQDAEDAACLRRLKEIAETNKDHQAALRFSADENRARRWIETSWFGSILDMAFSGCSNYGQSILRPFVALILFSSISMGLYKKHALTTGSEWWTAPGWGQSFLLSISNSLPFLPQSRSLREDAIEVLYAKDPSLWVDAIMIGQGVLSFIFLFLIGLGLRNRFRL